MLITSAHKLGSEALLRTRKADVDDRPCLSGRSRLDELLILCARIDFNP